MNIEQNPYNSTPIRLARVHIGLNIVNIVNKQCSICSLCSEGMNTAKPIGAWVIAKCSFVHILELNHE
jgi:hypothetical protein